MDLQPIVNNVIVVVIGILTLVGLLAPVLLPLIRMIKDERLRKIAEDWVAYAEQVSQAGVKRNEPPMTGELKYKVAFDGIKAATGIPDAKAQVLIESILGAAKLANGKK